MPAKKLTQTWTRKRQEIESMALTKPDKFSLLRQTPHHELAASHRSRYALAS